MPDCVNQDKIWDNVYANINIEEIDIGNIKNFHPLYYPPRKFLYIEEFFYELVKDFRGKRILSVGGGIDRIGLYLAKKGNNVVSIDSSQKAFDITSRIAARNGVTDHIELQRVKWEDACPGEKFDVVVIHDALHHMHLEKAIKNIYNCLKEGGVYIGMEPICLPHFIRLIHKKLPFYAAPFMFIRDQEVELSESELRLLKDAFSKTHFYFFDASTRASVAYVLSRLGCRKIMLILSRIDFLLTKRLSFLHFFSSYIVFTAKK